jgi:DNA repair protein RecN (Recombination protein N)
MLASLSIANYALIEKLSIEFSEGFSIITGETGAGKSILLGALGLVLGKRADLTSLKDKEEKCVIEAHFSIEKYNLHPFFEANDLDYDAHTIIRREILPSGKSRAFVNDSPVNLPVLLDLGTYLLDIHSQHQTMELAEEKYQFTIIDAIAKNQSVLEVYQEKLSSYKSIKQKFEATKNQLQSIKNEQEYNRFLFQELTDANLEVGQQEEFESDLEKLSNVELIKEHLAKAIVLSENDSFGITHNLLEFKLAILKINTFSHDYSKLFERVESLLIEFKDIASELNSFAEDLNDDPKRLELISQKLQVIYNLQKKHQVSTIEELVAIHKELEQKVLSVSSIEETIVVLENQISETESSLNTLAQQIHQKRAEAIPILIDQMVQLLSQLGMPNVRFKIDLNPTTQFQTNGKDELQFLFSANKGSDFGLLKKVASGGEMSRIMLVVKAILSNYSNLPTIILDEIDTGVSGEIAAKMGEIMKGMSQTMQVFAITHLPQIASKGTTHFKVYKRIAAEQTYSEIKQLTPEERIQEIAQMLSGATVSESAYNHARELLN